MSIVKCGPLALALCLAFAVPAAQAQSNPAPAKLTIGTVGTAAASLFVAKEEGFFAKRGFDASIVMVTLDPDIPAALMSGSLDLAVVTATTFFQAVDGGLDLVVVLGGTATSTRPTDEAVVAATGSGIHAAKDFVGRKVGVPGIGAALHVLFRYWLTERGVDFHGVNFVEAPLPRMRDMLGAKLLDATVAVNPFIGQITDAGVGYIAVPLSGELPSGKPIVMYVATREWAAHHGKELALFRDAIAEGAKFVVADPDKTRSDINAYVKISAQVLKAAPLSDQVPDIDTAGLSWWFAVMQRQGMLTHDLDVKTLLVR